MNKTNIPENSGAKQQNWMPLLRITLGAIIIWKAISFILDTATAKTLIERTGVGVFSQNAEVFTFIIAYVGLICGVFLVAGLFTKVVAAIQIPILFVAVFFVNIKNIGSNNFEFILSVVALLLLILFTIEGSGGFSLDKYFRKGAAIDKKLVPLVQ